MSCKHLLNGAPDCVFCHRDQLRLEVNGLLVENSNLRGVRDKLRDELSLAEEGLANYEEEVQAQLAITRKRDEEIERLRAALLTQAPIAKVTIREGLGGPNAPDDVSVNLYAPGLPPGEHDLI